MVFDIIYLRTLSIKFVLILMKNCLNFRGKEGSSMARGYHAGNLQIGYGLEDLDNDNQYMVH